MPSSPILAIPLSLCMKILTRFARSELRASEGMDVVVTDVLVQFPRSHSLTELGDVMRIVQEMNVLVKTCQPLASQSVY